MQTMGNFYVWPDNNIIWQRYIANKIQTAVTRFCSNISEKIFKTKITRPSNSCHLCHPNLY